MISADLVEFVCEDIDLESEKLKKYGVRNLEKRFQSIAELSGNAEIVQLANTCLGGEPKLVRAIFFDKTAQKNWSVSWHQDKTVTLNRHLPSTRWGPWTVKDGVRHVQPPVAVLDEMVTIRLHIDSADETNGCLKVIPQTHQLGILKQEEIDTIVKNSNPVSCLANSGDAIIMRPHILHSSDKAEKPNHRRVVHLEYSSFELPAGIRWA